MNYAYALTASMSTTPLKGSVCVVVRIEEKLLEFFNQYNVGL